MKTADVQRFFPLLLLLLCALTFTTLLDNGFMIDDDAFRAGGKLDNEFQQAGDYFFHAPSRHFYPLYYFLNLTKHRYFPRTPAAHYAANLVFYASACLLFYFFVKTLTDDFFTAAVASALFCVHPVNAENLTHADIINTLLSGAMMLAAFLCLIKYVRQYKGRFYFSALLFYAVAILCGEPALLFPLYAVLLLVLAARKTFKDALALTGPFLLMAVGAGMIWWWRFSPGAEAVRGWSTLELDLVELLAVNGYMAAWYAKNLVFPGHIFLINNFTASEHVTWIGALACVAFALSAAIMVLRRKRTLAAFALCWFAGGFLFVIPASLAHPAMGLVLEPHWLFFPTMGAILFLAILLRGLQSRLDKRLVAALVGIFIALFFVRTQEKNYISNSEAVYAYHWLKAFPGNHVAGLILSSYYEHGAAKVPPEMVSEMVGMLELFRRTGTNDRARRLEKKLEASGYRAGPAPRLGEE